MLHHILHRSITGIAAGMVLSFSILFAAYAAGSDCQFQAQVDQLQTLQANPSGDYVQDIRAELKLRKNILTQVLDCSILDATNLKSKLATATSTDTGILDLQNKLLKNIQGSIEYFTTEKNTINDLGVRGTQETAKNIRDKRKTMYAPLAERAVHLQIWIHDQELMKTAQNRFAQVSDTVKTLKLSDDTVQKTLKSAGDSLAVALDANQKAKDALLDDSSDSQSVSLPLKTSLEVLAQTYQSFFDLGQSIKTFLPFK
jgi:hypothetical protein